MSQVLSVRGGSVAVDRDGRSVLASTAALGGALGLAEREAVEAVVNAQVN